MCGVTGIYHFAPPAEVDESALLRMRDTMVHRGPDGEGVWIAPDRRVGLAHRRLAILDLSANAAQPMTNEDGTIWVTYNGEIYNHLGLRGELQRNGHRFCTDHSDTEVLVHGYEEWGLDGLLQRLDGDYAFALWDERRRVLSLARDRVGVKPLYFSFRGQVFLFGSEIKAILAHPASIREIQPVAMYHYLSFLTTPAPLTMFAGVYKLPAGHCIEVEEGGEFRARQYWDAVPGRGIQASDVAGLSPRAQEAFYIDGIRQRLSEAVEKRMMSDVPVGVFLSGGVDSSTNVALFSRHTSKINTFTVGFKDHPHLNELEYAQQIAHQFHTTHHEILIDEHDMVGYLDALIHSQDEPIADWVCIPLYFVSKLTRDNGVTVIQVGEGSDEQFSGYASYMGYLRLFHRYWQPFRQFLPGPARAAISALARLAARLRPGLDVYADIIDRAHRNREHFWSGATVFPELTKRRLVRGGSIHNGRAGTCRLTESGLLPECYLQSDTFNVIRSFLEPFDRQHPGRDTLTRMIYSEFKIRLPELLLMRVDKITMSESLEARVPFLDHRLVEFTTDIPETWKTRGGEPKYLLKKAVEGLIPDNIIYRKKMGFGAPMSQWLRGSFGRHVEESMLASPLMQRGFFDTEFIRGLCQDHRSGRRDTSLYIWTLFNLTSWYDYWIAGVR
jgi:asparagine synthase (glutamine-hydrolysing)